ncbi:hypothetical protein [Leptolyngbya ohadii]|uniref:hypothetical protein n=1 Tax=Leptolyngbya ohadii TaxID=1962290 RepID=UPI000B5A0F6E|nr:hypothetical protein [Leptolyngbya ohadii]
MRYHTLRPLRATAFGGSSFLRLITLPLTAAGLVAFSLPAASVTQEYRTVPLGDRPRDYEACTRALSGLQLAETEVATACAAALYPRSLGECVSRISRDTTIAATDALSGCRRVRRPNDLATCVVAISDGSSEGTVLTNVLDNCRRSLLPTRFSSCVVGLQGGIPALTTDAAMTNCIAASDRPRDFLPTFIPSGQPIPLPGGPADTTGTGVTETGVTGTGTITAPDLLQTP